MKKVFCAILASLFLFANTATFGEEAMAAKESEDQGTNYYAWGIGVGLAAALGTMVAIIATNSSDSSGTGPSH